METLILTMDTIALVIVLYFSFKSEKSPDKAETGPFRIRADVPTAERHNKRSSKQRVVRGR